MYIIYSKQPWRATPPPQPRPHCADLTVLQLHQLHQYQDRTDGI